MKQVAIILMLLINYMSFGQEYSKVWKDTNYAGDTMVYHNMDIYLPKVEKPSYPVVISIYGSAWFGNDLKGADLETIGSALLDAGFAVVTPNHRASTDAIFPAQINDIKAVIRYIRAKGTEYQIDTTFIGITGSSSGGHLAALAGTSRSVKQYTVGDESADIEGGIGQHTDYSSAVDAVVNWFGPTDFLEIDSCGSRMVDHNPENAPESILIGGPIKDNKDRSALANPITYIDSDNPPFLSIHGDKDPLVPYCQSELLHDALQNAGVPSKLVIVPGGGHGTGVYEEKYLDMMVDFFKEQYKNKSVIEKNK